MRIEIGSNLKETIILTCFGIVVGYLLKKTFEDK